MACIFNTGGDNNVEIAITLYFTDREPVGLYKVALGSSRTVHLRFNDFEEPEPVRSGTEYSIVIQTYFPEVVNIPVWIREDAKTPFFRL